ncbi:HIT family protein [Geobacter argillaceus]|uniref:HIT family protein n=1 Tax=Geobacter argillaceus TaxID=345631 RepID=UPI0011A6220D|nr:HIT family protein [Geobacter argillaceus]
MLSSCPFCNDKIQAELVAEHGSVYAIEDKYPVTEGHILIIPRRHIGDYFQMSEVERQDADKLLLAMKEKILRNDPSVIGFNIGMNCGIAAGQTIPHGHIHLIPRRLADTADPRGGVRGVIPEKQKY